jgi:hypothetical protein
MRKLVKLVVLGLAAFGGRTLYEKWKATQSPSSSSPSGTSARSGQARGNDTPTGTDPHAKWTGPGYEDKSLGQAVNQDQELVDDLVEETGGDLAAAEDRFKERSAGAPALARQENEPSP